MNSEPVDAAPPTTDSLISLIGRDRWQKRLTEIRDLAAAGPRAGQAIRQRHVLELTVEKLRRGRNSPLSGTEALLARIAWQIPLLAASLKPDGRDRLIERLRGAMNDQNTLIPLFHLLRTAMLHRARGFTVDFTGLEDDTPHDLLLTRDTIEAEVACDVVTAEDGHGVHRGAWFRLADRIDPDLQTWLAAHPGRYLLKMTLPKGLRGGLHDSEPDSEPLGVLHQRITHMLETQTRQDYDEAIVLRLDPLLLAGAQAEDMGLISSLRREFGPEAHLSVTTAGGGVFVMAARAGRENEVAIAIRRRLAAIAPQRLTGERPGILAMFVEDTDRLEWRGLRERLELFGLGAPDAAADGEIRFRNPAHPAAGIPALALAVSSSV